MEELAGFLGGWLPVSGAEVAALSPYVSRVGFAPGEVMHREGAVCDDVVLLIEGLARVFYVHDGREVNLRLVRGPAAAVALSSLITGEPSRETVAAITEARGFRVRQRDLEVALVDSPLIERSRRVLAEQHYLSMERRLRMLQHKSARERYDFFCAHMEPEIVQGVPGYQVASYLGISPESLSRVRAQRARGS